MSVKHRNGREVTQMEFDRMADDLERFHMFVNNLKDIARTGSIEGHTTCDPPPVAGFYDWETGRPVMSVVDFHDHLIDRAHFWEMKRSGG